MESVAEGAGLSPAEREELARKYAPFVKAFARKYAGYAGPDMLESLTAAAFLGLAVALDRFQPGRRSRLGNRSVPFLNYAKWHIRNQVQYRALAGGDQGDGRTSRRKRPIKIDPPLVLPADMRAGEWLASLCQRPPTAPPLAGDDWRELLSGLSPDESRAIELCYRLGLTQPEAGAELGLSKRLTRATIRRALAKLRGQAVKLGLAPENCVS